MYPILTRYGPFFLYSYTVVMGVGLLAAVGVGRLETKRLETGRLGSWVDGMIWAVGVGLVVGRAVFVGANWGYYAQNVGESWLLWQGGISYHGAVIAGLAALWAWSHRRGVPFARLGDLLALPMAVWSVFGWLACYLEGCAYGRETFIGLLSADLPDSYGVFAVRYQTQMMGLAFSLLAVAALWWARRRGLSDGRLFWLALLLLSWGRALVGVLRGDEMVMLGAVRVDVLLDAALAGMALVLLVVGAVREPPVQRKFGGNDM